MATDITEGDTFDIARSLRYQADRLRAEAAALDSTASFIEHRYGNPADVKS